MTLKSLVAILILGAAVLVGACNSTTSSTEPSFAPIPTIDTTESLSPDGSPEASPS